MLWSSMEHFRKLDGCLVLASSVREEMKEVEAEVFSWLWGLVYKGWDLVLCDSMKHNDLKRFCVC